MDRFPVVERRFMRDGVRETPEKRLLIAEFGDGYEQVAEDGINTDISSFDLEWQNLPKAEGDAIYDFLFERLRAHPFLFTIPGSNKEIQVKCIKLSRSLYNLDLYTSIQCTFKRDYSIVS